MKAMIQCSKSLWQARCEDIGVLLKDPSELQPGRGRLTTLRHPERQNAAYTLTVYRKNSLLAVHNFETADHIWLTDYLGKANTVLFHELHDTVSSIQAEEHKGYETNAFRVHDLCSSFSQASAENAYLVRKHLQDCASLFLTNQDGDLIVPMVNVASGKLRNMQTIYADGCKRFEEGCEVAGNAFIIKQAPESGDQSIYLGEGAATVLPAYVATGAMCVAALTASNLLPVGLALRSKCPDARIVVIADNDAANTNGNVGLQKATITARTIGGWLAVPNPESKESVDLHDTFVRGGVDAVIDCLDAAEEFQPVPHCPSGYFYRFDDAAGLYADGGKRGPIRLGSIIFPRAWARDNQSMNWGLLVNFNDDDGAEHRVFLDKGQLSSDGGEWLQKLNSEGWDGDVSQRALIRSFFINCKLPKRYVRVDKTGWYKNCFVLANRVIGLTEDPDDTPIFSGTEKYALYSQKGSFEGWKEVAALAGGSPVAVLFVCASLAGPLIQLLEIGSGGFNVVGSSSSGKTTILKLAASVHGDRSIFLRTWRSTDNGLEGVASARNGGTLILDELGMATPHCVSESSYMLGGGRGKQRASRTGDARPVKEWYLIVLSSGEVGLAGKLAEGNLKAKAGQEVRFVDIVPDGPLFPDLHGFASAKELVESIDHGSYEHNGYAYIAFLEHLVEKGIDNLRPSLVKRLDELTSEFCSGYENCTGQVSRVAKRFAVAAVAGELAVQWGILPECYASIKTYCQTEFDRWVKSRGGVGPAEHKAIIDAVVRYVQDYGESRFIKLSADLADRDQRPNPCAGFVKIVLDQPNTYLFYKYHLIHEVLKGFDFNLARKVLNDAGMLVRDRPDRWEFRPPVDAQYSGILYAIRIPAAIGVQDLTVTELPLDVIAAATPRTGGADVA